MKVLDNGYVNLKSHMGDDLQIVNAARKSFARESDEFTNRDRKLLKYLYVNRHTSPFEMVEFLFEVKAPLFVVRQWRTHRTWSYNEVSRRYTSKDLDFHYPQSWRLQDTDNKQSSNGEHYHGKMWHTMLKANTNSAIESYNTMIENGVCREQARMILPQNMMVELVAKTDLHNLIHFLRLRLHSHAQWEIQEYARAIVKLIEPVVPETMKLIRNEIEME